jgi:hypothetical protein
MRWFEPSFLNDHCIRLCSFIESKDRILAEYLSRKPRDDAEWPSSVSVRRKRMRRKIKIARKEGGILTVRGL